MLSLKLTEIDFCNLIYFWASLSDLKPVKTVIKNWFNKCIKGDSTVCGCEIILKILSDHKHPITAKLQVNARSYILAKYLRYIRDDSNLY